MAKKLDPKDKVGQIDLYKEPEQPKSSIGETLGGFVVVIIVVTVLVNIYG